MSQRIQTIAVERLAGQPRERLADLGDAGDRVTAAARGAQQEREARKDEEAT
jgi:hypothetical protein